MKPPTDLKVRIAGDPRQVEQLTALLRAYSKTWGARKVFRVRRYNRKPDYHRTLGKASRVNYIRMKLPKEES